MACCNNTEPCVSTTTLRAWYASYVVTDDLGLVSHGIHKVVAAGYFEAVGQAYLDMQARWPGHGVSIDVDEESLSLDEVRSLTESPSDDMVPDLIHEAMIIGVEEGSMLQTDLEDLGILQLDDDGFPELTDEFRDYLAKF